MCLLLIFVGAAYPGPCGPCGLCFFSLVDWFPQFL